TTFQEPSTDIGYKKKKRLAKSGKDKTHWELSFSILNANLSTAVFFSFHSCGKKRIRQWKESKILVARKIISTFTASFCRFREHFFPKFAASFPQFSINH
ncbi:hypothetical protein ABHZ30_22920, partial [Bacteroides uniformis]